MKKIAFFLRHFGERGTEVSTFDYAHYNEVLLGNKSVIISLSPSVIKEFNFLFEDEVYRNFKSRFEVFHIHEFGEIHHLIERLKIDIIYFQTHGAKELPPFGPPSFKIKSIVHCVFNTRYPQGTIYAAISDWVNEANKTNFPVVPYMVRLPETDETLRRELNIPDSALVFGRYGGYTQFDIDFVHEAVVETALRNSNIYFVFMNTQKFCDNIPNIRFLPAQVDLMEKRKFINTCDAHIHARSDGETFGLACGEFAICMKPLITYRNVGNIAHIEILKDQIVLYENKQELIKILTGFYPGKYNMTNNGYLNYSPVKVMDLFDRLFIRPPVWLSSSAKFKITHTVKRIMRAPVKFFKIFHSVIKGN